MGLEFLPYAIEMLNIHDKSKAAVHKYKNNIEGVLELCASTIPEQYLLPHIIKAFKEIYPKVLFFIYHKDSKKVAEDILSGITNFGLIGAKYSYEGIDYIDFYADKLVLITCPEKSFDNTSLTSKDLIGEDIVLREEGSGTRLLIENALKEQNLDLNIFQSQTISYSLEAIKKMVSLDIGLSFSSEISVKNEVNSGHLNQYEVKDLDLNRDFSLAYCNNRYLSPLEKEFKEFVSAWKWDKINL